MTSQRDYIPLLQSVRITNSDGTVSAKTLVYTHYLDKMVILPFRETIAKGANTSAPLNNLKIVETEYSILSNGDLKPAKIKEARYSVPGGTVPPFVDVQTFAYNAAGLLVSRKDEGGRSVANIYDYNNKFVVATIANADPVIDKPAYTSFETSSFGGWTLGGSGLYSPYALTGTRGLDIAGGGTLSAPLNTTKANRLSVWSGAPLTVNAGAVLIKTGPTLHGFTYYEYNIPAGASSVTLSGPATIDELRVYPQSARMTTSTFDPIIGKTQNRM